jgi:hypothetical protein
MFIELTSEDYSEHVLASELGVLVYFQKEEGDFPHFEKINKKI